MSIPSDKGEGGVKVLTMEGSLPVLPGYVSSFPWRRMDWGQQRCPGGGVTGAELGLRQGLGR